MKSRSDSTKSLQQELPDGVQAEFDHFLSLDDSNADLMAIVNVSGNIALQPASISFCLASSLSPAPNIPSSRRISEPPRSMFNTPGW